MELKAVGSVHTNRVTHKRARSECDRLPGLMLVRVAELERLRRLLNAAVGGCERENVNSTTHPEGWGWDESTPHATLPFLSESDWSSTSPICVTKS
jgi:hypothetical protein